jgi:hypothetical protein
MPRSERLLADAPLIKKSYCRERQGQADRFIVQPSREDIMKSLIFAVALAIGASAPFAASADEIIIRKHDVYSHSNSDSDRDDHWRHRDRDRRHAREWRHHRHHRQICETKRVTHWRHHRRVVERITVCS